MKCSRILKIFRILNDQGKGTEMIKMHLSLQHYCHFFFYCLSLTHFKHRENVIMLLRRLLVSIENRYTHWKILYLVFYAVFSVFSWDIVPSSSTDTSLHPFPLVCGCVHTSARTRMCVNVHVCIIPVPLFLNFLG